VIDRRRAAPLGLGYSSRVTPRALSLRHVAPRIRDLDAAERFFVELPGYRVEWRPDPENVYLARDGDNVTLQRAADASGSGMLDHVGLLVARAEDVDVWARGAALAGRPRTHRDGARSLDLSEGLVVQFIHHLEMLDARPE